MKNRFLTKSLIMKGLQCPKQLFLSLNSPDLAEEESDNSLAKQEGTDIGILAHRLFPNGVLVKSKDPVSAIEETLKLKENKILFEAAFNYKELFFRADICLSENDCLEIIEVKSSTDVKDYHIQDIAVQFYILKKLNLKVSKLTICHINKNYTNDLPVQQLFTLVDVTERVAEILPSIEVAIENLRGLSSTNFDVAIGPHCSKPFSCPFKKFCFSESKVEKDSVLSFPNLSNKWELFRSGKTSINQLTDSDVNTSLQRKFLHKHKREIPPIDADVVLSHFQKWVFPLYFLDFETFSTILPKYPETKPNAKIPFQFSLCRVNKKFKKNKIQSYIANGFEKDPRYELAVKLVNLLGRKGSIVGYNASFEKARIIELSELFPDLKDQLIKISNRIVDLLEVMKQGVYIAEFKGSWSIKSVVPALFGQESSYSNLKIKNGIEAQLKFMEAVNSGNLEEAKESLIEYCDKDVLEMIRIFLHVYEKAIEIRKSEF